MKFAAAVTATFGDYVGLALMTPALPFFLEEVGIVDPKGVALWTGAVNTSQFVAVVIGNIVWGFIGDRLGAQRALALTMFGDVVCFSLTAVVRTPLLLVIVRFFAGLSTPLVPALLFIFDRATSAADSVRGVGQYVMSILLAYCAGGVIISTGYDALRFMGTNLVSAGVCGVSLGWIVFLASPSPNAAKPRPSGVLTAVRTTAFLNHGTTSFVAGSAFGIWFVLVILMFKDAFSISARETGFIYLGLPVILFGVQLCIGRLVTRFGHNAVISAGGLVQALVLGLSLLPVMQQHFGAFLTLAAFQCIGILSQMLPNQTLARTIANAYATNAVGAVTGMGRVCFALGQGTSPVIGASLYVIHPSAAYAYWLALQIGQFAIRLVSRQPFLHDPPLGSNQRGGDTEHGGGSHDGVAPAAAPRPPEVEPAEALAATMEA